MKLNLLPTSVSKASAAKTAAVFSVLLALLGIAGAVGMIFYSKQQRDDAYAAAQALTGQYTQVDSLSKSADTIIASAQQLVVNTGLAEAMSKHNDVYPALYDEVRRYIPSFFRINAMSATPGGADRCTVTLTGAIQTQQQYADLMLALLRIPGATNVGRAGYNPIDKQVPPLSEEDQLGLPIGPGESNLPSDPVDRLNAMIQRGSVTGFVDAGGFGGEPGIREAMPDWSMVTVTVSLPRNIQTPDPRATLSASGGAPAPGVPSAPAPAPQGRPAAPGDTGI